MISELRESVEKAMFYIDSVKMGMDQLSLGHLAPSVIRLTELRCILIDIRQKAPKKLPLPTPIKDVWYYYKTLNCVTVIKDRRFVTLVNLPLLEINAGYEVYRVHNVPLPCLDSHVTAVYEVEACVIAMNEQCSDLFLPTDTDLTRYSNPAATFCCIRNPVYKLVRSRQFAFELSIPMTNILNSSLASGIVPAQWKRAVVVPVPKVIPTPALDKLRPISLTSTLSKVCETFVSRWMMDDMLPSLDPYQFGNRKGRSTSHYLVELVQYVLNEAEAGRYVNLLTIDYSKAFDKADITVALRHLLNMNVRRELIPWISNFLSSRQQCVKLASHTSEWSSTTCGVPQGTKLGPVVFLAMVNLVATESGCRWKYVDDITVGESCNPMAFTPPF